MLGLRKPVCCPCGLAVLAQSLVPAHAEVAANLCWTAARRCSLPVDRVSLSLTHTQNLHII